MNYGELKTMARLAVPAAKKTAISDTTMALILNAGAKDVAIRTRCLPTSATFNMTTGATYDLASLVERFGVIDESGLWYLDSNSVWQPSNPKTRERLDKDRQAWRNLSSDEPTEYIIKGSTLTTIPAPSEARANGFLIYFSQVPLPMTNDDHFPFGNTSEIPRLAILWECIIDYWRWRVGPAVGKPVSSKEIWKEYIAGIEDKKAVLDIRPDLRGKMDSRMRGRPIS